MTKFLLSIYIFFFVTTYSQFSFASEKYVRGIYINEVTMRTNDHLKYLVEQSKKVGINTFVVDFKNPNKKYAENVALLQQNGINYVARIVVFPNGADNDVEALSRSYWEEKYKLAEKAIQLGAKEIQLDYIRYESSTPASEKNAQNIYKLIKWFKNKLSEKNIPLQIDVFGIASFGDSLHIGQSVKLFSGSVDAICPMVYPSHLEPYKKYARQPYLAVRSSLKALRKQFENEAILFKIYPFIELSNYRYPLSGREKINYIDKQLDAVKDSEVDGWYAWSVHNKYDNLFTVLKNSEDQNEKDNPKNGS